MCNTGQMICCLFKWLQTNWMKRDLALYRHPSQKMWVGSAFLSELVMPPDNKIDHIWWCDQKIQGLLGTWPKPSKIYENIKIMSRLLQTSRQESKVPGWWRIVLLSWPGGGTFKFTTLNIHQDEGDVTVVCFEDDILLVSLSKKETLAEASNILSAAPFAWK